MAVALGVAGAAGSAQKPVLRFAIAAFLRQ